jgi:hypothetical protein
LSLALADYGQDSHPELAAARVDQQRGAGKVGANRYPPFRNLLIEILDPHFARNLGRLGLDDQARTGRRQGRIGLVAPPKETVALFGIVLLDRIFGV